METTTDAIIPKPKIITPVDVEIRDQIEYPDDVWRDVIKTVADADEEVLKARRIKRAADVAYAMAMRQREVVQAPRDQMIATDSRIPARIGNIVGIGRSRCSQLRIAIRRRMGLPRVSEITTGQDE